MSFLKKLTRDEPEEQTVEDQVEDIPGTLERIDRLEQAMTRLEVAIRSKEAELVTLRGLVHECPRCSRLLKGVDRKRPQGKGKVKQKKVQPREEAPPEAGQD